MNIILLILLTLINQNCFAVDRCDQYKIEIKNQSTRILGPQWPWYCNLAQLSQESNCRANITAFDGGQGMAQFMPATEKGMERKYHTSFNPYDPKDAMRMQSLFLYELHQGNKFPNKPVWLTFQAYNGGYVLLQKEYLRSIQHVDAKLNQCTTKPDWEKMKPQCRRKKIPMKGGRILDLCDVNYNYSIQIYRGGKKYYNGPNAILYW
jgi:soluble lytic murein transglycosylase-like protein